MAKIITLKNPAALNAGRQVIAARAESLHAPADARLRANAALKTELDAGHSPAVSIAVAISVLTGRRRFTPTPRLA